MDAAEGTIRSALDPTKCLDNLGGSTAPGNRIGIWDCETGDESQQWSYDTAAQTLNLTSAGGVCLDLPGGTPVNGNWLEVWGCAHQRLLSQLAVRRLASCTIMHGLGATHAAEAERALCAGNGLMNQEWTLQKPSDMPTYCQPPETCPGGSVCPACGRLVCPCPAAPRAAFAASEEHKPPRLHVAS
jgi:hypothetical protein